MFLSLIKLVNVLESPNKGEWYKIIAQAVHTAHYVDKFFKEAETLNLQETSFLIRYQVYEHPTNKLSFKKGKLIQC